MNWRSERPVRPDPAGEASNRSVAPRAPVPQRRSMYSITICWKSAASVGPRSVAAFWPSMNTGAVGCSPVPGSEMPMSACLLSPGPLTMQPITATFMFSTPG